MLALADIAKNAYSTHFTSPTLSLGAECERDPYARQCTVYYECLFLIPGIMLDNVQCFGDEKSLSDCQTAPWGTHDCDVREAAGVFCGEYNHVVSAGCKGYRVRGCMRACVHACVWYV